MKADLWLVVVIMGDAKRVETENRGKDRNSEGTGTLRARQRKSSPPKKCGTEKIAKKPAGCVGQLPEQDVQTYGGRKLSRMALKVRKSWGVRVAP